MLGAIFEVAWDIFETPVVRWHKLEVDERALMVEAETRECVV